MSNSQMPFTAKSNKHSRMCLNDNELHLHIEGNPAIRRILNNPVGCICSPHLFLKDFPASVLKEAHAYFSVADESRYTYSVCTRFLSNLLPILDNHLYDADMLPVKQARYWPFWHAVDLSINQSTDINIVANYLCTLWNVDSNIPTRPLNSGPTGSLKPLMIESSGRLTIVKKISLNHLFCFKCTIDIPPVVNQPRKGKHRSYNGYLTIIFDEAGKGFYSANAKIKCADELPRHRYVEIIDPDLKPPSASINNIVTKKRTNITVVLDRHIGDSLSILSTHVIWLSQIVNKLLIDASRCYFLSTANQDYLRAAINSNISITSLRPNYLDWDMVFDPYDLVAGIFVLKPQNDSGAITIISALELAHSYAINKRRDILDIHISSLRRWGFYNSRQHVSFIKLPKSHSHFNKHQATVRALGIKRGATIVALFPFGSTDDRKYPHNYLRRLLLYLLQDRDIVIVMCGSAYDTPDLINAIPLSNNRAGNKDVLNRIVVFREKMFSDIAELMIASDVILAIDAGPLHLARALRLKPIALYTSKMLDKRQLMLCPWFVEDGTIECLLPKPRQQHVHPKIAVRRIKQRLNSAKG